MTEEDLGCMTELWPGHKGVRVGVDIGATIWFPTKHQKDNSGPL